MLIQLLNIKAICHDVALCTLCQLNLSSWPGYVQITQCFNLCRNWFSEKKRRKKRSTFTGMSNYAHLVMPRPCSFTILFLYTFTVLFQQSPENHHQRQTVTTLQPSHRATLHSMPVPTLNWPVETETSLVKANQAQVCLILAINVTCKTKTYWDKSTECVSEMKTQKNYYWTWHFSFLRLVQEQE